MAKKMKMTCAAVNKTIREGFDDYLNYCRARNLRDGTLKHYTDSFKQIKKYCNVDTPIEEVSIDIFNELVCGLRENKDLNDVSRYTYSRDFKTILRYFMKEGLCERFTIEMIRADKQPTETYTDAELKKLLRKPNVKTCSFSEYKAWVIVSFLMSTGIRMNSLMNIKNSEVDIDDRMVYINVTKNRKPLQLPLNQDIANILRDYMKVRGGDNNDYLFCNVFGDKLTRSTVYHALYEYNKSRGVERTGIHRFRHTFAKKWILNGGNVITLQKILGHSSLQITQNYINLLVCDIKHEVEEINILREFKDERIKMK